MQHIKLNILNSDKLNLIKRVIVVIVLSLGLIQQALSQDSPQPFITSWSATAGESISIGLNANLNYDFDYTWRNASGQIVDSGTHTSADGEFTTAFSASETHTLEITGAFPHLINAYPVDLLLDVVQWGDIIWESMNSTFASWPGASFSATDAPNLSQVTDISLIFSRADNFNQDLNTWNVSNVTNMSRAFLRAESFNGNISDWETGNVTDMSFMFAAASNFNGDVSGWDVGNVTNMNRLFNIANDFNADLSRWNVQNVTDMFRMFRQSAFDQNIGSWDVGNVDDMGEMFSSGSLSSTNYDSLLIGWSALANLQDGVNFNAGNTEACAGQAEVGRLRLINNFGWNINDAGICDDAANLLSFEIDGEQMEETTIDFSNHTVDLTVAFSTDLSTLSPDLAVSEGASVVPAPGEIQNFTNPVIYTVTAEDGVTAQEWTVTVSNSENPSTETDIISFDVPDSGFDGIIDGIEIDNDSHQVIIFLVPGEAIDTIAPVITVSPRATISPVSGDTINISSGEFIYLVTAEDQTTQQDWAVVTDERPRPENDLCINATLANIGETIIASSVFATSDASVAPACGSNGTIGLGIWYRLIGTGEEININTCGNGTNFDTSMSLYTGSCTTGLTCITGNDDDCGLQSVIEFNSIEGEEYFILIEGFSTTRTGNIELTISASPALPTPPNDDCEDAELLTVFAEGEGTPSNGNTTNAATFARRNCDSFGAVNDVWFRFNSGPNVEVAIDLELVDTDGADSLNVAESINIAAYTSCKGDAFVCDRDGDDILLEVTPNTNYFLQLWNDDLDEEGTFTIQINDGPNTAAEIVFANAEANVIDISRFVQTGTQIDSLIVADDEGHAQVFSITAGNDEGIFRIDSLSGSITIADEALLLGSAATFLLTILSEDQGPGDITSEISLTVNVIDNAPPVVTDTIVFIDENSSDDTFVAAFEFSDPDGDFLFPLDGTITPEGILDLSEGGVITVQNGSLLDFETNPSIEVTYTIGDGGPLNLETTGTIIVNLNDVNEAPEVAAADFNISQFSPNGFEVGNVEFTDQDNGQEHTFAITTGNDEGIFTINDTTGLLTISDNSNLTATDYELTVEVADNGAPILARSASVSISAFSNEPPVITAETFSVEENANSGTAFGQLTFSDPDGDLVDLSIIDGNELGVFEIDGSGDIQVLDSTSLDFETNPTFELVVQAQDNGIGTLTSTATIVINLLDVNEAPSVESESFDISSSIATGDLIGQVEAEDPDIDVLTYSLTTGNDQGIFAINETTGVLSIADASLLDPATVPQHELTVEVTDGELSDSTEFIINVFLNNAPLLNTLSFTIDENNSPEATIGTLKATDEDGINSYAIIGGNEEELFELESSIGQLSVSDSVVFDFEQTQEFELTIRVTDNGLGNVSTTETITVSINDVNEFDPVVTNVTVNELDEQSPEGTEVAQITSIDNDIFQSLSYAIIAGNTGDAFTINNDGLIIVNTSSALDFETMPVFNLSVEVSDDVAPVRSAVTEVSITLNDIEESAETDILTFTLEQQTVDARINTTERTVDIEVAFGTGLTTLIPALTLSDGATSSPASGEPVDFTNPVTYTVLAEDLVTTADWTVTVTEEIVLSIEDDLQVDLHFYPNPVSDVLNVNTNESVNVYLTDLNGRKVTLEQSGTNLNLDLKELNSGVYLLILENFNGEKSYNRIIKE